MQETLMLLLASVGRKGQMFKFCTTDRKECDTGV